MAGERPEQSDLAAVYTEPFRVERLTQEARVSSVATCKDRVLAALPSPHVDRIHQWDGKAFAPIPALELERASTPTLTTDCRLAFVSVGSKNGANAFAIKTWRDGDTEPKILLESPNPLSPSTWGPGGALAVVDLTAKELVIAKPDGTVVRAPSPWPDAQSVEWSVAGRLAMTDWTSTKVFTVDGSGAQAVGAGIELKDWVPLTWSTDGSELLMHHGATLATARGAELETITVIGDTGVPVHDAGWAPNRDR